jgi:3-oxoacyl-[acyl-carrier-protein] synthase-3
VPLSAPTANPAATRILGLGHYQPSNVVTNDDLVARGVDTNDEWIKSRLGIAERRYADPAETVVDMAVAAAGKALANAGVSTDVIDLVVVATCTMPNSIPTAAPQVAARLGINAPGAYDLNSGCAGFVYGLTAAAGAIQAGQARNVLVVASERFSGWLDFTDRSTCVILADAAAAAVVGPSDQVGFGPIVWGSDGDQAQAITINPETGFFTQEGQAVFRWASSTVPKIAIEACEQAGVKVSELAAFVPHQANLRIIEPLVRKIGIGEHTVVARDIVTSGNTSASSIPLALSKMVERGEIPSGSPVLLVGFGAGLAYAAQVVLAP